MMLFIVAVTYVLHLYVCSAGDPCPLESTLAPCTCTQVPVNENGTVIEPTTTPATVTTAPVATAPVTTAPVTTVPVTTAPEAGAMDYIHLILVDIANGIYNYTVVQCNVSKTLTELEETVSTALNRKVVDKLVVANVPPRREQSLARLPSGWLKNVRVRQFEVSNSKLYGDFIWNGNPFEGQERSLLLFAAKQCSLSGSLTFDTIGTTNTKGLNTLPRLEVVDFSHNYLTSIMAISFRNPPTNLSTVVLSHNSIQLIEGGTFQFIAQLKHVDLSHNMLETIVRAVFPSPARRLEHIDLSWNSLETLPLDFFNNMPVLKSVNVSNNFLYSMPDKPWKTVWAQLTNIDATNNFVDCNCDLMWLLPILSPTKTDGTTAPGPLPGQTVSGSCSRTIGPLYFAMKYDLVTLTKERLSC